jgi:hypothetical protein
MCDRLALNGEEVTKEIEVTPEMIAAGIKQLTFYNNDYDGEDDAVKRIFCAMFDEYLDYLSASGRELLLKSYATVCTTR